MPVNDNVRPQVREISTLRDVRQILPHLREIALHSNQNMVGYLLAMAIAEIEVSLPSLEEVTEEDCAHVREVKS